MSSIQEFILEKDDDTYIYGGLKFHAHVNDDGDLVEPFIHTESDSKIVKYYSSKNLFVVYVDNRITELIFTMTCWSDDYKAYEIKDNVAYSITEYYHGRCSKHKQSCNFDFTEFITDNNL